LREVLQSLREASAEVAEVVAPRPSPGHLLIRSVASVVSAGTERMLTDFARASLVGKARQQPDRVRQVLDKARTDGLVTTLEAVRARLDEPLALGYANAGRVIALGAGVSGFSLGDLVASNGPHAEVVSVPATLCALVPEGVEAEAAATASLAAIALQGIRLAAPSLGERFVVTGLGLIGLLAVQLLVAHGCEVMGVDIDPARLDLAARLGATQVASADVAVAAAHGFARGRGVDGVIVAASSRSSDPIHQAAVMCRQRGRIVLVGVTGLELDRADFYEKELSFQVSCSYGPGRYDSSYEDRATDYPFGLVRWTAGRNMAAALDMMASGRLDAASLLTHRFPLAEAPRAYETLGSDRTALGIVLEYPPAEAVSTEAMLVPTVSPFPSRGARPVGGRGSRVGVIGAGAFATRVMLPALRAAGADIVAIAGRGGPSATVAARQFDAGRATNDPASVIEAPDVDVVFVFTRHDSHAPWVQAALAAGKHVFVEKPLAIDAPGLETVIAAREDALARGAVPLVGVGFNRRFAPVTQRMVELLGATPGPRAIDILVNAGPIPASHWTQDPAIGGGRLVGEGCHFIDLARFLAGSPITGVAATALGSGVSGESASVTLSHADGSVSTIGYYANGSKRFPKERVTVLAGGRVLVNDNFRRLTTSGWPTRRGQRLLRQDKGHGAEVKAFLDAVQTGGPAPIPFEELAEVTAATLLAAGR